MNWNKIFKSRFSALKEKEDLKISGISTDSRAIDKGQIFFAIQGDSFDGHKFIGEALVKSESWAVVESSEHLSQVPESFKDRLLKVPNVIESLRDVAGDCRSEFQGQIIAVAGSNGKTTTKEWIAHLLTHTQRAARIFKTAKSENSILGTALSLTRLQNEDYAVIEIGIDEPGWMAKHLELVRPHMGLITCIQEEHLARLGDIETVAREELKLLEYIVETKGAFAANLDSPYIRLAELPEKTISYSLSKKSDLEALFMGPSGLHVFGRKFLNPLPGAHNAQNLLAALAILKLTGFEFSESQLLGLQDIINAFHGEAHRSQWIETRDRVFIFDDCYNANPSSMESALETFQQIAKGRSMLVVLGDMKDLGESSEASHRRIINLLEISDVFKIFLFGPEFQKVASRLPAKSKSITIFEDFEDLERAVQKERRPDLSVLLKGSRSMRLERLLQTLAPGHLQT